jgi:tetratricopeptide (TPR) repeat protein
MKNAMAPKRMTIYGILLLVIMISSCGTTKAKKAAPVEPPLTVEDAPKFNARGEQFNREKRHILALDSFSAAIRADPAFQPAYINRGLTYYFLGRYSEAIQDFDQAILLGPQDIIDYTLRGESYNELQQYSKAIIDLTKAIELVPMDRMPYNARSISYSRLGRFSEALADLDKAISIKPSYEFYVNRGTIYAAMNDNYQALDDFKMSLRLNPNPNDAVTLANCGEMSRRLGLYEDSLNYYNQAITLDPGSFGMYNGRAWTYFDMEKYGEALRDINQAIWLNPNGVNLYAGRGQIYYKSGRYQEAMNDFDKAIAIDPGNPAAYYGRGCVYFDLSNYDKSLSELNKSLELSPNFPAVYDRRGQVYAKLADLAVDESKKSEYMQKAEADFETSRTIPPAALDFIPLVRHR